MTENCRQLLQLALASDPSMEGRELVMDLIAGRVPPVGGSEVASGPLMTIRTAAAALGVCRRTFQNLLHELPADLPRHILPQRIRGNTFRIPAALIDYLRQDRGEPYRPTPRGRNARCSAQIGGLGNG